MGDAAPEEAVGRREARLGHEAGVVRTAGLFIVGFAVGETLGMILRTILGG